MEAVLRAAFPRNQNRIKTPKRRNIRRSSNFISNNNPSAGLLNPPTIPLPLDHHHHHHHAYALLLSPPFSSSSKSYQQQNHHHQPPLLPLPTTINPPLQLSPRNMPFPPKKSSKPTMMRGNSNNNNIEVIKKRSATMSGHIGMFSDSTWFNVVSPPPSSLPMPQFCLRTKLQ